MFAAGRDADRLVAGIPAAARAVREAQLAGLSACRVMAESAWQPGASTRAEVARLSGAMPVDFNAAMPGDGGRIAIIRGDALPAATSIAEAVAGANMPVDGIEIAAGPGIAEAVHRAVESGKGAAARLDAHGRAILRSTSKPTDGIVSRFLNRPVSQAISAVALRIPGVRPVHATIGTALIALAMLACLLSGGPVGLVAGAILFQAASIFDGVDGEVARATWRTSLDGARMDSLIDAATNLAFLGGVAVNMLVQGRQFAAMLGFTGLVLLATGLFLIGRASARRNAPFTFDIIKDHYRARSAARIRAGRGTDPAAEKQSQIMQWLTFLTSRDFFALVFAVLIATGFVAQVLALFAIAAAGWLAAVLYALTRQSVAT